MLTETITIEDEKTGKEFEYTAEKWVTCEHCGYSWDSGSDMENPTCPGCQRKTPRNYDLRYHFYSKQTCWIQEEPSEEQLYDRLYHTLGRTDVTLYVGNSAGCYAVLDQVNGALPLIYTGHPSNSSKASFRVDEDALVGPFSFDGVEELVRMWNDGQINDVLPELPATATEISELSPDAEQWPTTPPKMVDPYARSMRNYARKLEVLTENGWELVDSDGENLWFEKTA